jgi:hypothetical protein
MNKSDKFSDYPKAATENAKKALEWRDKYGREEVDAGTPVGWQRANQLAKGEALSYDVVSRMAQFNRHRKNSTIDPKFKDTPWKDRGYVAWLIWGGDEGVDWAMKTMDQIKKEETNERFLMTFESFSNALLESRAADLLQKQADIRSKISDTNSKINDIKQKIRVSTSTKAPANKVQLLNLSVQRNILKLKMLNLDAEIVRMKLRYESAGLEFPGQNLITD